MDFERCEGVNIGLTVLPAISVRALSPHMLSVLVPMCAMLVRIEESLMGVT